MLPPDQLFEFIKGRRHSLDARDKPPFDVSLYVADGISLDDISWEPTELGAATMQALIVDMLVREKAGPADLLKLWRGRRGLRRDEFAARVFESFFSGKQDADLWEAEVRPVASLVFDQLIATVKGENFMQRIGIIHLQKWLIDGGWSSKIAMEMMESRAQKSEPAKASGANARSAPHQHGYEFGWSQWDVWEATKHERGGGSFASRVVMLKSVRQRKAMRERRAHRDRLTAKDEQRRGSSRKSKIDWAAQARGAIEGARREAAAREAVQIRAVAKLAPRLFSNVRVGGVSSRSRRMGEEGPAVLPQLMRWEVPRSLQLKEFELPTLAQSTATVLSARLDLPRATASSRSTRAGSPRLLATATTTTTPGFRGRRGDTPCVKDGGGSIPPRAPPPSRRANTAAAQEAHPDISPSPRSARVVMSCGDSARRAPTSLAAARPTSLAAAGPTSLPDALPSRSTSSADDTAEEADEHAAEAGAEDAAFLRFQLEAVSRVHQRRVQEQEVLSRAPSILELRLGAREVFWRPARLADRVTWGAPPQSESVEVRG